MVSEQRRVVTPTSTEVVTTGAPAAAIDRMAATTHDPYAGRRAAAYRLV